MAPLYPSASNTPPNNDNHNDGDDDLPSNSDVLLDWLVAGPGVTVIPTAADATGAATSAADSQEEEEDVMATTVSDSVDTNWGPLPWLSTSGTSSSSRHLRHHLPTDNATHDYYFNDNQVDDLECLDAVEDDDSSYFGFARSNYMESIRTWTCGKTSTSNADAVTAADDNDPSPQPWTVASRHTDSSTLLSMTVDTDGVDATHDFKDDADLLLLQAHDHNDECPPPMVRSTSDSLSSEETADEDETMSNSTTSTSDDDEEDDADADDSSVLSDANSTPPPPRGVTFNEQVRVLPIPPIEHYTPEQRYKMYANRFELRENKLRNKREYEFDNYDWRNATEEHCMAICPMSGELLHPAHF